VARLTAHAGQSRLLLTLNHAAADQIKAMITNVRTGLDAVIASAPQLRGLDRWRALVRYIVASILAAKRHRHRPAPLPTTPLPLVASG
jgi:hypothetical protein